MASIGPEQPVARGPVLWRRSGDQILIRRRGDDELVVLAGTGGALWNALVEPTTLGALARRLADEHDAPLDTVGPDVDAAVARLVDEGVVITA